MTDVALFAVKLGAAVPLKVTVRTSRKCFPVIVIGSPTCPPAGENPVIVGGGRCTVSVVLALRPLTACVAPMVAVPGASCQAWATLAT